jgi:hypothetical protein
VIARSTKLSATLILVIIAMYSHCIAGTPDPDPLARICAELVPPSANQALAEIPAGPQLEQQ